jgi:transcriptional regulator with XRE-family HTH domain
MSTSLDDEVKAALVSMRGDWLVVAREAGVSHSWISKFVNGHIPNPGYRRLMKLREYAATKSARRAPTEGTKSREAA